MRFLGFVLIGRTINNYQILSLLGEGGMGQVFLAQHSFMGRKAAVKVLHPELARNETLVHRFLNEARAANAIRHPNIIDIIDAGILPEDRTPYLLMEFLEGESLASRLRRLQILDIVEATEIARQTASALAAAHSQGIVHRDLKPDNLFLVPDSLIEHGERVKVLDFGIAKLRGNLAGNSEKTQSGAIMGTPAYMSPEQCQGLIEQIDHSTDIYSLGIILFEMICGKVPFVSMGFADLLVAHVTRPPPSPIGFNPLIPEVLSATVLRALAKDPNDRFASMSSFQMTLNGCAASYSKSLRDRNPRTPPAPYGVSTSNTARSVVREPTSTFRATVGESLSSEEVPKFVSRHPGRVITATAILLAAAGIAAGIFLTRTTEPKVSASPAPLYTKPITPPAPPPIIPKPAPTPTPEPSIVPAEVVKPAEPEVVPSPKRITEPKKVRLPRRSTLAHKPKDTSIPPPVIAPPPEENSRSTDKW
jgi:serine/threonine-protein kinase